MRVRVVCAWRVRCDCTPRRAGLLLDDSSADCCHRYALLSAESKSNGDVAAEKGHKHQPAHVRAAGQQEVVQ